MPLMPPEWTVEQAAELFSEQMLTLLDGCDDDDTVRPQMVMDAMQKAWAPLAPRIDLGGVTAGELRARIARARSDLAQGEKVP